MIEVVNNHVNCLRWLDKRTGARTVRIFEAAKRVSPLIDNVVLLIPYNIHDKHQEPSMFVDSNTREACVILQPEPSYYEQYFVGVMLNRFNNVRQMLGRPNYGFNGKELLELTTSHELGHAARYLSVLRDEGSETAREMQLGVNEKYLSLPLQKPTSVAAACWAEDSGGYRTDRMAEGVTEAKFQEMLAENLEAYTRLPEEAAADEFTAQVISLAYAA